LNAFDLWKRGRIDTLDLGADIFDRAIANALADNGPLMSTAESHMVTALVEHRANGRRCIAPRSGGGLDPPRFGLAG